VVEVLQLGEDIDKVLRGRLSEVTRRMKKCQFAVAEMVGNFKIVRT
jgi:hypothetical protein